MADVTQTIAGDSASAQKAYSDLAKQVVKLEEANAKLSRKVDEAGRATERSVGRTSNLVGAATREIGGMVAGWVSVTSAINVATQALDEYNRNNAKAASTQLSVADAQAQVIKNSASASSQQRKDFLDEVRKIQAETRFPDLAVLTRAGAEGLSASAGNIPAVQDALRAGASITRDRPADLPTFVGASLDMGQATGNHSAKENLEFVVDYASKSRVVSLEKAAKSITPLVAAFAGTTKGDKQQAADEASAFGAALTSAVGDTEGTSSAHAGIVYNNSLNKFFTEGAKVSVPGVPMPINVKPKTDPGTFEGRVKYLQEHPRERKAFEDTSELGEAKYRVPLANFMNRGSVYDQYKQNLERKPQQRGQTFEGIAKDLTNATPELRLADAARAGDAAMQSFETLNTEGAIRAEVIRSRDEALAATRGFSPHGRYMGYLTQNVFDTGLTDLSTSGIDHTKQSIAILKDQLSAVRIKGRDIFGMPSASERPRDISDLNHQERAAYDMLASKIEALTKVMEHQAKLIEQEQSKQRQPQVAPAIQRQREAHQER